MSNNQSKVETAVFQKAKKGQQICGDSYFYTETEDEFICVLADGLGSGTFARESSDIVISAIKEASHITAEQLIMKCHRRLSGKRGVVVGILKVDFQKMHYTFSSIGNIGLVTIYDNGTKKRNIPNPGYLANYSSPLKTKQDNLQNVMTFILFSDGVTDTELAQPFIVNSDVNRITATYKDYINGQSRSDDTTLIASHIRKKN